MSVDPWAAIRLSLWVATWCTLLALPLALGLGWLLARREFVGKAIVSAFIFAPMVVPPVVTGLALLTLFGRRGWFGDMLATVGVAVPFSPVAAVLAALVVGLPLFVMSARTAFEGVDPAYEELATTLGDSNWRTFWRVSVPLALPGLAGGATLMFARSLGEFGATIVLAGNTADTRTIALAIYSLLEQPGATPEVSVLAWTSVGLSLVALVAYEWFVGRQRQRLELPR